MKHRTTFLAIGLTLALVPVVSATPIGDAYFLDTFNFPGGILNDPGSLTFNATGDLTAEIAPGSAGGLQVTEQVLATLPGGVLALQFQFDLLDTIPDFPNQGFAFRIRDLDFSNGVAELDQSFIQIILNMAVGPPIPADLFVTESHEADGGLTLLFETPAGVTWAAIAGGQVPNSITVNFFSGVQVVPEPSMLFFFGSGLLGSLVLRRRRLS